MKHNYFISTTSEKDKYGDEIIKTHFHTAFYWSIVLTVSLLVGSLMYGCPRYSVWQQEMAGKAEIERAKGMAEAIRIENGSLTGTYIQYLWVRQQGDALDKVVYIPTEANLPILEAK